MKVFFVHHALREKGNPPSDKDGLKPLGVNDAKVTAELLKDISAKNKIVAIYTSPYYRCRKTADIINGALNVPIYEETRFNEFENIFAVLSGKEIESGTESWVDCQVRVMSAIKDIVNTYEENDVVVCVTSGANITAFVNLAYGIEPREDSPLPWIPSCSPIGFNIEKSNFKEFEREL